MKKCSILGCTRPGKTRNFCNTHYFMWWKHGDPEWADKGLHRGTYGPEGNTIADFWAKVVKGGEEECWGWTAAKDKDGYGFFWWENVQVRAHRFMAEKVMGLEIKGVMVCHTCDNPGCVNPKHLFVGTARDNVIDCHSKKRSRWSRRRGKELTEEEYADHFSEGGLILADAAKEFGVSAGQIYYWMKDCGLPYSTATGPRMVSRKRLREMVEGKRSRFLHRK